MIRSTLLAGAAALALSAVASHRRHRRPRRGPGAHLPATRPVRSRARPGPADPPGRRRGRLCPRVGRHHDRQRSQGDLAGGCRQRRPDAPGHRRRLGLHPALVAGRQAAGLCVDGRWAVVPQLYVMWMATGVSARVAQLPASPGELAWSPDSRTHRLHHAHRRQRRQPGFAHGPAGGRQMGGAAGGDQYRHLPRRWRRLSQAGV